MIRVTRRYRFSCSHRLHSEQFSEDENYDLYGKCNNPHGHGHNYVLEVTVRGPIDQRSGQAVRPESLDGLVNQYIVGVFDRKNLNLDIAEFGTQVPTTENLVREIERRLISHWNSAFPGEWPRLETLRLQETRNNRFELHYDQYHRKESE